nr:unnamed protein product [Callosobruchus analis]
MSLILYGISEEPPTMAVLQALSYLELNYKFVTVDYATEENDTKQYLQKSPQREIPLLDDDADKYPKDETLYPKDPQARAIVNQRLSFNLSTYYRHVCEYSVRSHMLEPVFFTYERSPLLLEKARIAVERLNTYLTLFGSKYVAGAVQITSGLDKFIIVSLYRPCNGSLITFFRQFELLINMATKNVNFVFIAGDFNIELKDENSTKTDLEILIQSYGMRLLINDYTRVTVSKKSCIDNIITNYGHNCITDTIDLHTSDHRAQVQLFSIENNSKVTYTARRLFTQENIDNFIISLQRQDWDAVYSCNLAQVNQQWETPFTSEEIIGISNGLKNKWSSGDDGIPTCIMKKCIRYISDVLSVIAINFDISGYPLVKKWYETYKKEYPDLWKIVEGGMKEIAEFEKNPPDLSHMEHPIHPVRK